MGFSSFYVIVISVSSSLCYSVRSRLKWGEIVTALAPILCDTEFQNQMK